MLYVFVFLGWLDYAMAGWLANGWVISRSCMVRMDEMDVCMMGQE